jgi:uncharacterized protein
VVDGWPTFHTGDMAGAAGVTAFVTEADGFIGSELLRILVAAGHQVFALTGSLDGRDRVRRAGATPVVGDLLAPGKWQDETTAEWVFHLPPHPLDGGRVSRRRAAAITRDRVVMDANLLDAVAASARRIVYVADACCYGPTGCRSITEDEPSRPSAWRHGLTPALDRLDGYIAAGLPIVTAFPGWVYGNGSWFGQRVMKPVLAGSRVLQFGKTGPLVSPIHVHDCARALVHLAQRGEAGGGYFLVNNDPVRLNEFATRFAALANRPLRTWRIPAVATRLVVGPILADYVLADAVLSNIRLRGIGFRFEYPTLEQGLQQILGAVHE